MSGSNWLGDLDSNQDWRSQSPWFANNKLRIISALGLQSAIPVPTFVRRGAGAQFR
jgi:hypothetical protein